MNPAITTPAGLYFDQLRDILSVESQVTKTLPGLSAFASNRELRRYFEGQLPLTLAQRDQILEIFDRSGEEVGSDESKAMKGLIEGGDKHLDRVRDPDTRDLMLVAHYSRILHYEIAAYQFTADLARRLARDEESDRLGTTLDETLGSLEHLRQIRDGVASDAQA